MDGYHLRRSEKELSDQDDLWAILEGQKFLTLAMCRDNEPYLVTLNYAIDRPAGALYFHCARDGRKVDYLLANPNVWGQVVEDRGYLYGACDHAYRSVHFAGRAEFLENPAYKKQALALLIERLEENPDPLRARLLVPKRIEGVMVGKINILALTGKRNGL